MNKKLNLASKQGFTLVELLLVIGIIATLAVVVFVALDPAKRFADARDAKRTSDVETILSAVHQFVIDNKGGFPVDFSTEDVMIGISSTECAINTPRCNLSSSACVDLSVLSKYLKTVPFDPQTGSEATTQYAISKDANGLVTVKACAAEGGDISVSR